MPLTDLIPHQTITSIVENVAQAHADIAVAFTLLLGAKKRLGAVLGEKGPHFYDSLWSDRISDYGLEDRAKVPRRP